MDDIAADTEYVKLKHLVPDPANPNRRESIVDIKDSLRAFGQDQDLVIQRGSNFFKLGDAFQFLNCLVTGKADEELFLSQVKAVFFDVE